MKNYLIWALALTMAATLPFAVFARDNNNEAALPIEKATSSGQPNVSSNPPSTSNASNADVKTKSGAEVGDAADVRAKSATSFGGLVQPIKK